MKDAKGHGSDPRGGAAHQQGVQQVGAQPATLPPESPTSRELRLFADNDASEKRGGGSFQDVALGHQLNIARKTVKMPAAILGVMGGMTAEQAHSLIQQHGSAADKKMAADYAQIPDHTAAAALAQGGAKSATVPTHPAMKQSTRAARLQQRYA